MKLIRTIWRVAMFDVPPHIVVYGITMAAVAGYVMGGR